MDLALVCNGERKIIYNYYTTIYGKSPCDFMRNSEKFFKENNHLATK